MGRQAADRLQNQRGVTYLMLMFAVVLIGITTTAAAKQWKAMVQREREADLLAKGMEIQNALALYSAARKAGACTITPITPPCSPSQRIRCWCRERISNSPENYGSRSQVWFSIEACQRPSEGLGMAAFVLPPCLILVG